MRGIFLSYVTGPERCAVTDIELESAESVTRVVATAPCPNRPEPMSYRLYGAWLCLDHCKVMEQG